jgi:hypothetical protein
MAGAVLAEALVAMETTVERVEMLVVTVTLVETAAETAVWMEMMAVGTDRSRSSSPYVDRYRWTTIAWSRL